MTSLKRKVLHVVEAYGGGVETMIKKYLLSTESGLALPLLW